jgi:hypothetical protein
MRIFCTGFRAHQLAQHWQLLRPAGGTGANIWSINQEDIKVWLHCSSSSSIHDWDLGFTVSQTTKPHVNMGPSTKRFCRTDIRANQQHMLQCIGTFIDPGANFWGCNLEDIKVAALQQQNWFGAISKSVVGLTDEGRLTPSSREVPSARTKLAWELELNPCTPLLNYSLGHAHATENTCRRRKGDWWVG